MILDNLLKTAEVLQTGALAGAVNSDVIDLQALVPKPGEGERMRLMFVQTEVANNFTTWTVILQKDTGEAFGSPTAVLTWAFTRASTIAALGVYDLGLLPNGIDERYLRLNCTPSGGTQGTTGKGYFFIVKDMKEGVTPVPTTILPS